MADLKQLKTNDCSKKFSAAFQEVLELARSDLKRIDNEMADRFLNCLEYNLAGGKRNRGLFLVKCFQELNPQADEQQLQRARILGWCTELFQSHFLISDDIMDNSITRRGQPCWYRLDDVGLVAINDACYFQNLNFQVLKRFFGESDCYMQLVELFLETYRYTVIGQCLDMIVNPFNGKVIDFESFTIERFRKTVQYKTSYYTFSLPIRCALYLLDIKEPAIHAKVEEIMLLIGQLYNIQDDYMDVFGDPKVTGKVGTDIIMGKCSWMVVRALESANEQQSEIIKKHYGKNCVESVKQIKLVFEQLRLKQTFTNLEENSYRQLNRMIIDLAKETKLPESAFNFILHSIYKRVK